MLACASSYYHHHYHLNRCRQSSFSKELFSLLINLSQISCSRRQPNKPQLTQTSLFQFNRYKDMCNLCIFTFDCMSALLRTNQAAPCRLPRSCYYFGGHSHSFYFGHPFILIIIHIMTEGRLTRRLISFLVGRSMLMLNVGGHYNASNCDF